MHIIGIGNSVLLPSKWSLIKSVGIMYCRCLCEGTFRGIELGKQFIFSNDQIRKLQVKETLWDVSL